MDHSNDVNLRTELLMSIDSKSKNHCKSILPFPREFTLKEQTEPVKIPKTFRMQSNYNTKLKNVNCTAVYGRINALAMKEAVASGKEIKPVHTIAPLKTSVTMFSKQNAFRISRSDYDSIQQQAKSLPAYFNWMDNEQISRPFNQGLCGSCWAVAAATCLSDVFVVSKKTPVNPNLSPTYLLSCAPQGQCDGGDPSQAVSDLSTKGITTSSCLNYNWCWNTGCGGDPTKHFDDHNVNQYIPPCSCSTSALPHDTTLYYATDAMAICIPPDVSEFNDREEAMIKSYLSGLYGNVSSSHVNLSKESVENIQALIKYYIYTYGPVIGGFHVFTNFMRGQFYETNGIYIESHSYNGVPGIDYSDVEASWVGSHAVVIVGWGEDTIKGERVPYWVVRNSWGTSWGNQGVWKMAMYGNDPNKKCQNRISQFEYPSIVTLDNGIGITGGMLLMKAGEIKQGASLTTSQYPTTTPQPQSPQPTTNPIPIQTHQTTQLTTNQLLISFIILLVLILAIYYVCSTEKTTSILVVKIILIIMIAGLLMQLLSQN